MEGWIKIGVQRASVLYPNSCYNEQCVIEVQVYTEIFYGKNEKVQKLLTFFQQKILAYFRYIRLKF